MTVPIGTGRRQNVVEREKNDSSPQPVDFLSLHVEDANSITVQDFTAACFRTGLETRPTAKQHLPIG